MLWEFDEEVRDLVHDQDVTLEGQIHKYTKYIIGIEEENPKQTLTAYKTFLRIFQEEFPNPEAALQDASPAVVFQVLQALYNLHSANSGVTSKKAVEYYNQLINALKNKAQEFLKDISSVDEAMEKHKTQKDNSWVLFEMLSLHIINHPAKTQEDQVFADFIMEIFKKTTEPAAQNNSQKKPNKKNKKKVHASSSVSNTPAPVDQGPKSVLLKEILALKPVTDTVNFPQWRDFFMALCEAMVKHMPYQNKRMEAYDLMMCDENSEHYKSLIKEAIIAIPADHVQRQLLLIIIGKFNDGCIQYKHAPVSLLLPGVLEAFSEESTKLWEIRAKNPKIKNTFFNKYFTEYYLKTLTPKQRYELRMRFEDKLAKLPYLEDRVNVIKYCADKLGPEKDPSPATTAQSNTTSLIINNSAMPVKPGQRNEAWDKFITKVYTPFSKANTLWDASPSVEEKLAKLQPMLAQFKENFPLEKDRDQAQRFFISFIDTEDCKFADGAQDYAWLFLEEMIPHPATRQAIRDLKDKLEKPRDHVLKK